MDTAFSIEYADTMNTIHVRGYQPDDWQRLCEIHDASRLDELRHSAGLAAFLTLEQTAQNEGLFDACLDVAEVAGVVQGFVAYSDDELTWLYVSPAAYRQGVGRALLRHAIDRAGDVLNTEVLEGNAPALQLYLAEGFTLVERVEGRLAGNETFAATGFVLQRKRTA
ncbi:MAG: GNAT family N-acetyltransferase [Burkholderiaceae bacterium]